MADTWFSQIESKVLTYVQYMLKDKLLAPYPNLNCTTKNQNTTPYTSFPTLYIHVLTPLEQAQDLENNEVNSVLATLEFQVFSNKSEDEANKIMTAAISCMKDERWNITLFPDPTTRDRISSCVTRFRKLLTKKDI